MKFTASEIPHARRARMLGAKNGYITLRDLKSSDDPLWVEDDLVCRCLSATRHCFSAFRFIPMIFAVSGSRAFGQANGT